MNNYPIINLGQFNTWLIGIAAGIRESGGRFFANTDIYWAYQAGGIVGALKRCDVGIEACRVTMQRGGNEQHQDWMMTVLAGWFSMTAALAELAGADV